MFPNWSLGTRNNWYKPLSVFLYSTLCNVKKNSIKMTTFCLYSILCSSTRQYETVWKSASQPELLSSITECGGIGAVLPWIALRFRLNSSMKSKRPISESLCGLSNCFMIFLPVGWIRTIDAMLKTNIPFKREQT